MLTLQPCGCKLQILSLKLNAAHQADEEGDFEQCGKTDVAPEWNWVCNYQLIV